MNEEVAQLLKECERRGIRLLPTEDGNVTIDAPKNATIADLISRVRNHKPQLLRVLNGDTTIQAAPLCNAKGWDELDDPGIGCDKCGSIMLRWDLRGEQHCMECDPGQSQRVLKLVSRLMN